MSKISQETFLEFSKPFISASKNVFETMIFSKIEPQKPSIKKDCKSRGDISAIMGLTGKMEKTGKNFSGMLVLSWPLETYLKIASAMLMETFTEYKDEISDVGAEISNMITGNSKRELKGLGYCLDMAIPSTISGKDHSISYLPGTVIILIPMISAHGGFYMEICFKENNDL